MVWTTAEQNQRRNWTKDVRDGAARQQETRKTPEKINAGSGGRCNSRGLLG